MSTLDDRGRALEDEFFHKENKRLLDALKVERAAADAKQALRGLTGIADDGLLDALVATGLSASNLAMLSLVPLVAVAWADGIIEPQERSAIQRAANERGLTDPVATELLEGWLSKHPPESLLATWEKYVGMLRGSMTADQSRELRHNIVGFARGVAQAAGGFLGIRAVSSQEEAVLKRIEAALT